jgi:endoglucanase
MKFTTTLLCSLVAGILSCATTSYAEVAPLSVQGNQVLVGGKSIALEGMSLHWANTGFGAEKWHTAETVKKMKTDFNADIVRTGLSIGLDGGYDRGWTNEMARIDTVIQAAIDNNMYVAVGYNAHIYRLYWSTPTEFFFQIARKWGGYPNVIYEIYNEQLCWFNICHPSYPDIWYSVEPYATTLAQNIRFVDPDNLIIVGLPKSLQNFQSVLQKKVNVRNVAYGMHFYANSHRQTQRDALQAALNSGLPLFATEWSATDTSGDGALDKTEADKWINFLRSNKISHTGLAYHDSALSSSYLNGDGSLKESGHYIKSVLANPISLPNDDSTPPPTCPRYTFPTFIEAEYFCTMSGVQTENTSDAGGGKNVGWIDFGDSMSYQIEVPTAGKFKISYRVAGMSESGFIQLNSGAQSLGTLQFAATGNWQAWQTVSHEVNLPAGKQTLTIKALSGGWNLGWFKAEPVLTIPCTFLDCPEKLTPIATIEAEAYSAMSGIQVENASDAGAGKNVGWIDSGDWLSYSNTPINIPATGIYEIEFRVASLTNGGNFNFEEAGGSPVHTSITFPATGGWQTWVSVKKRITLTAGTHKFGLKANSSGFNINWFKISKVN